jgi:hypothetical protein
MTWWLLLIAGKEVEEYGCGLCTNHVRQVNCANKFCAIVPDNCGSSVCNFLHVTHLGPRILRWLPDFWKTYAPCFNKPSASCLLGLIKTLKLTSITYLFPGPNFNLGHSEYATRLLLVRIFSETCLKKPALCLWNKNVTKITTYLFTPWSRVLLEKLTGFQIEKNSLHFMEPKSSLPHSQVPTTRPYPEPAQSSPNPHIPIPENPS